MPDSTPANTACDRRDSVLETCSRLVADQIPNFLRLYVNPHVAQACWCLAKLTELTWPDEPPLDGYQVFLANSGEEALNGAMKLARFTLEREGRPTRGRFVSLPARYEHVIRWSSASRADLVFIPDVDVVRSQDPTLQWDVDEGYGFIVTDLKTDFPACEASRSVVKSVDPARRSPLRIVCVDRLSLPHRPILGAAPDIVVFDESFTGGEVPFGAFLASRGMFEPWRRRGMHTFHSTTFQPNSLSSLHFLKQLAQSHPMLMNEWAEKLSRIEQDANFRARCFSQLFSAPLTKLARIAGVAEAPVRAAGHYIEYGTRRVFDGVAGVACSVRGHNPPHFVEEMRSMPPSKECWEESKRRFETLAGLPHAAPAVSGAAAVELAFKLALVAQAPKTHILTLRGGYAGKTIFALTGTWQESLKRGIGPLYPHVVSVDPFAPAAAAAVKAALQVYPVALIHVEAIQGVGGVRAVPEEILRCISEARRPAGPLLLVDEIQTGMFRTGPFCRSTDVQLAPDLMTIGKATSDMMAPSSFTLYSQHVHELLHNRECRLAEEALQFHQYPLTFPALLRTLRTFDELQLSDRVRQCGARFSTRLHQLLADCPSVKAIRCFGLLVGIELDSSRGLARYLGKLAAQLAMREMLFDEQFPLLMGFCQYEPHVLKFTPPLSITDAEIDRSCETIARALRLSNLRLLWNGVRGSWKTW